MYIVVTTGFAPIKEIMYFNPLNAELSPICHLLALLGVHHFLHVSRIRVNYTKLGIQFIVY
jgi:hypothetical protein